MVDVRPAHPGDEPRVRELLAELGYPPAHDIGPRLAQWTGHEHRRLLVAELDHEVLGLVAITLTPRLESDTWWAQVVALVVDPAARGRSVGQRLLEHVEEHAARAGCDAVLINSARDRTAAQRFYTAAGYHDRCADHAQFIRKLTNND